MPHDSPRMPRLFVAIELPPEARAVLGAVQRELAALLRAAGLEQPLQWIPAANIHLTLRFLGDTRAPQQAQIEGALAATAREQAGFQLRVAGLGAFPSFRRPSVLWAGVDGTRPALEALLALQAPIERAARAAGFTAEERPWSPHLTLARFRRDVPGAAVAEAGALLQQRPASQLRGAGAPDSLAPFLVEEIVLMRSDLRPQGALYTPVARYRLNVA